MKWVYWANQGFPKDTCPWRNPREMRKHKPRLEIIARTMLDEKIKKLVHDMNTGRDTLCTITSVRYDDTYTLVGDIEGYNGVVWYNPYTEKWMKVLSSLPNN